MTRLSAAQRHCILFVALVGTGLIPLFQWNGIRWDLRILPARESVHSFQVRYDDSHAQAARLDSNSPHNSRDSLKSSTVQMTEAWGASGVLLKTFENSGWLLILFFLAVTFRQICQIKHESRSFEDTRAENILRKCLPAWLSRRVQIRISNHTPGPFTAGFVRPFIVLPQSASSWTDTETEIVLHHEWAHIRRWDCLSQLLGRLACAIQWWNPVAWLTHRQLRLERERACDDWVLGQGARPIEYAERLVSLASRSPRISALSFAVIPMARSSQIKVRIRSILASNLNRRPIRRGTAALIFATTLAASCLIAGTRFAAREADLTLSGSPTSQQLAGQISLQPTNIQADLVKSAQPAPDPIPDKGPSPAPVLSEAKIIGEPDARPETLPVRRFKTDPERFIKMLEATAPPSTNSNRPHRDAKGLTLGATNRTQYANKLAVEYFTSQGVDFGTGSPRAGDSSTSMKAFFFNDRTGLLVVRATVADLNIVETALQKLNLSTPVIEIEVRVFEISDITNRAASLPRLRELVSATGVLFTNRVPASTLSFPGLTAATNHLVLETAEAERWMAKLTRTAGVDALTLPRVTTTSGRKAQVQAGETVSILVPSPPALPLPLGPSIELVPTVADDTKIELSAKGSLIAFLGYSPNSIKAPTPQWRISQTAAKTILSAGQTLVLGSASVTDVLILKDKVPILGDIPGLGRLFRSESKSTIQKNQIWFVTPKIIDGNKK